MYNCTVYNHVGFCFFPHLGRFECLKGSKRRLKRSISAGEQAQWLINTKAVIKINEKNKAAMEENEALQATCAIAALM